MKRTLTSVTSLYLLCALSLISQGQTTGSAIIYGQVKAAVLNEPIAKAEIAIYRGETLIGKVHTDAEGRYAVSDLPDGELTIKAWALGFVTERRETKLKRGQKKRQNFKLKAGSLGEQR